MPYVTSVERLAKAEGKAGVILAVLHRECGSLPAEMQNRIGKLTLDELDHLQQRMFDFHRVADVQAWLDGLGNGETG